MPSSEPHRHTASSNSDTHPPAPGLLSVGMDNNPSEAFGYEFAELPMHSPFGHRPSAGGHHRYRILNQGQRTYTYTSRDDAMNMIMTSTGGDGNNTGAHSLLRRLLQELVDLEAASGGQAAHRHRDAHLLVAAASAAATPVVQEPPEQEVVAANLLLEGVLVQAFAAFLPTCVTADPLLKDAPDHVRLTVFGGLASITFGLFAGILSRSVARRGLAIRLVSFSAIAVLTFSVASQLTSRPYIALTALVGVALNLLIMLLRF